VSDSGKTEPVKVAILTHPRRDHCTCYADGHWEGDDGPLVRALNQQFGGRSDTMLPWNLSAAQEAAKFFGGTLEVLVKIRPLPDGAIP